MIDTDLRTLEREARTGDAEAVETLKRTLLRLGKSWLDSEALRAELWSWSRSWSRSRSGSWSGSWSWSWSRSGSWSGSRSRSWSGSRSRSW